MIIHLSGVLLVCSLVASSVFEVKICNRDPKQLCANIRMAFNEINSGSQQIGGGTHVNEVKKAVDGPALASVISGNYTELRFAAERLEKVNKLDDNTKACIADTVKQAKITADYIDTIKEHLTNDLDKMLDVQRTLRQVVELKEHEIKSDYQILYNNIVNDFNTIDSGTDRIAAGEDVIKVKSEVDGPALASLIRGNFSLLLIFDEDHMEGTNKEFEQNLKDVFLRAEEHYTQIEGILDKLTEDKDKVNAVFKAFRQVMMLQEEHQKCFHSG